VKVPKSELVDSCSCDDACPGPNYLSRVRKRSIDAGKLQRQDRTELLGCVAEECVEQSIHRGQ
jgi:hypothetical protein